MRDPEEGSQGRRNPVCRRKRKVRQLSRIEAHLQHLVQTNGVPPRMALEFMRHSDRRLTDQVYLDTTLLLLQEHEIDRQVCAVDSDIDSYFRLNGSFGVAGWRNG